MKQNTVAKKITEIMIKKEIIDKKHYSATFTLIQQVYAIGVDTGRFLHIIERPTMQMDLNGRKIKIFDSAIIASRKLEINQGSISAASDGRRKTAGGFKWKYIDK